MKTIVIVDKREDLPDLSYETVTARSYLTNPHYLDDRKTFVLNLSRSYRYQSLGYYVSLLAAARGHRVIPEVQKIQDFRSIKVLKQITQQCHSTIQKGLADIHSDSFELSVYFGQNVARRHERLARELFAILKMPLFRVRFENRSPWIITGISMLSLNELPEDHRPYVAQFAEEFLTQKKKYSNRSAHTHFDLAILVNPDEKSQPSDPKAIDRFVRAGEKIGFKVEIIFPDDINRLAEFDALFIRETTAVNHHTYRFARLADAMGLVVLDDPDSILKCTNKVFLAEVLHRGKIPTPGTHIVHRDNYKHLAETIRFPTVLKLPDSSFSVGVIKINDAAEWEEKLREMFEKSDLLLAQDFLPTEYDWRIGLIDGEPLFACRYFMARGHWQVYDWKQEGRNWGRTETLPLYRVPDFVIKTALDAAELIGDGLYGVDIKEIDGKAYVIEVNDNPNIDAGTEDEHLKEELYLSIMRSFLRRIEARKKARDS